MAGIRLPTVFRPIVVPLPQTGINLRVAAPALSPIPMEILKEEKLCVCCGKQFRGDVSVCPDDDDELVSLNENPFEGTQFEREFQIVTVLGLGGWGIVYRARDILIERDVAIKMLHSHLATNQQRQRRFKREATVLADLSHPNIATVLKYDTLPDSRPFVVMEFLAGKTLDETLAETRTLPVSDAIKVFIDTCDALAFAHAKGVVHRDIKPSNLMLTKDHHGNTSVKVLDFGLAKIFSLDEGTNLTRTGETIGTPNYMSPEQGRGLVLDQRSDIYSLGCVMYETFTGVKPVRGASFFDCMQRHVSGDVIPPSVAARGGNVGADLEQIIMKAMAKDPENRYQSATHLKSDLEVFASTIFGPQGASGGKVGRRSRSNDGSAGQQPKGSVSPLLWLAAVALLSMCAVSAVLFLQNYQRSTDLTPTKVAMLDSESSVFLDNLEKGFTPPKSSEELLAMSEAWTRSYGYNHRVQNEMRHHYMTRDRTRMKECIELVFKMDMMDEYEFQMVTGWKMENPIVAIDALSQAASEYRGYPHTESACYIRIGDIHMMKGDREQAMYNYQRALLVRPETAYTAKARTRLQTAQRW